jgi:hypothetical protein
MVLCLVLNKDNNVKNRFIVDITESVWDKEKISRLQVIIKDIKKHAFREIDASDLKLWKVSISTKNVNSVFDKNMETLMSKPHMEINIEKELDGLLLETEDNIKDHIDKDPIDYHIHIIVQPPPPATAETDKGIYVREYGKEITFPFPLTITTQRRLLGKFRDPPNANNTTVPEKVLQNFFMDECTELGSLNSTKLMVYDTHSIPLLDTREPGFVFVPKGWSLESLNVAVVGEIRAQSSNGFSMRMWSMQYRLEKKYSNFSHAESIYMYC